MKKRIVIKELINGKLILIRLSTMEGQKSVIKHIGLVDNFSDGWGTQIHAKTLPVLSLKLMRVIYDGKDMPTQETDIVENGGHTLLKYYIIK